VLASTAPSTNAMLAGIAATAPATAAADASTRPTASTPTGGPQVTPGEFFAGGIQQRRQDDQADHIGWYADLRHTREQADQQPRDHQQGGSRDTQLPGESRGHGAQHYQQQDRLDTAHATDLASLNRPMNADQASRRATFTVAEALRIPRSPASSP
jgi:hypothetical protein